MKLRVFSRPKVDCDGGVVAQPDARLVDGLPTAHVEAGGEGVRDADVIDEMVVAEQSISDHVERCRAGEVVSVEHGGELLSGGVGSVPATAVTVLVEVAAEHNGHAGMMVAKPACRRVSRATLGAA